jgi:hypothetical protein
MGDHREQDRHDALRLDDWCLCSQLALFSVGLDAAAGGAFGILALVVVVGDATRRRAVGDCTR